jgi:methionyl-tRNA formyltransferase
MKKLKVIFAGTPDFAAKALKAIIAEGHEVVLVMTQPDRPAGRGLKLQPSAVKSIALENGLPLLQPTSLKLDGKYAEEANHAKAILEKTEFDVMVVAAYGLILPQWTLDLSDGDDRHGCLNIHASLLPRWRGAAPIQRAIWSGDIETGTCIMKMNAGLDTGPVILRDPMPIESSDNTASLHGRLAEQGARLINEVLKALAEGKPLELNEQSADGITYAEKIKKEESIIDWRKEAVWIDRQIRALNPAPGAMTKFGGEIVKVWHSELVDNQQRDTTYLSGEVVSIDGLSIVVATGAGCVRLLELQKAGGKKGSAGQFAQQVNMTIGMHFGE